MTLGQLRALVAVVEARSFSAAAERLALTQSGVSHAIASLEAELGAGVLRRGRAGPVATPVGERVLVHARAVLQRLEHIHQEVAAAAGPATGRVRLGTPPSVAARVVPGMLAALRRRQPGIDVVLFEGSDPEVDGWLRTGAVDVGIVPVPRPGFDAFELVADEMLAVLPAGHPLARRRAIRLRDVAADPFIMSKGGCEPLIRELFRAAGLEPRVQQEVRDMATILGMVQEGLGVTVVPALALPSRAPRLRALALVPRARRRLGLAVPALAAAPPAAAALVRAVHAWARDGRAAAARSPGRSGGAARDR
jgi:DNA-binding transcriptional LysR family regulator